VDSCLEVSSRRQKGLDWKPPQFFVFLFFRFIMFGGMNAKASKLIGCESATGQSKNVYMMWLDFYQREVDLKGWVGH